MNIASLLPLAAECVGAAPQRAGVRAFPAQVVHRSHGMIIIVMGVSGSGKTTVGRLIAGALNCGFLDGDTLHGAANVEKMRRGIPLTDEDRAPWLRAVRAAIEQLERRGQGQVIACSALKQSYRDVLRGGDPAVRFVYLKGSFDLLAERLKARKGHFFDPRLLRSQFEALEEPSDALTVDVSDGPQEVVDRIVSALGFGREGASPPQS